MFKRKCHKKGESIRVVNGLIIICKCITYIEIELVINEVKSRNRLSKGRLPKGHFKNAGCE